MTEFFRKQSASYNGFQISITQVLYSPIVFQLQNGTNYFPEENTFQISNLSDNKQIKSSGLKVVCNKHTEKQLIIRQLGLSKLQSVSDLLLVLFPSSAQAQVQLHFLSSLFKVF
jgi:hypothetical protein